VGEKALHQLRSEVLELLADRMPGDKATALADRLSQGTCTHDHPIGFKEAQELGLPVRSDLPEEFYQLMGLFPQPTQRQPSVQYIPVPSGPPSPAGAQE